MKINCLIICIVLSLPIWTRQLAALQTNNSRRIPDDNLAYPVMVSVAPRLSSGSGFYLNTGTRVYLVTAGHVLFRQGSEDLIGPVAELSSYSKNPAESERNVIRVELSALKSQGLVAVNTKSDIAVVQIGNIDDKGVKVNQGVTSINAAPSGILAVTPDTLQTYDKVLIANNIVVFGYPIPIGLQDTPQLDHTRPLLRNGIVAGKNDTLRTLILDSAVYPGNSGGPVLEIDVAGVERRYRIIGVVLESVLVMEEWLNTTERSTNTTTANSGYAIAAPTDAVLEVIGQLEQRK